MAQTTFTPNQVGNVTITAIAQTTNNPTASTIVHVNSAGSSTYNITMTSWVFSRTSTSVTYKIYPYITYASNGQPAEGVDVTLTTNLGLFQNQTQVYTGQTNSEGHLGTTPQLTTSTSGIALITITAGPSSATFNLQMIVGLPLVQPFYSQAGAISTSETEPDLDWTPDGQFIAFIPGKIYSVPYFQQLFSGTSYQAHSLSYSMTGQKLLLGYDRTNPLYSVYNTVTNTVQSYDPATVANTQSVAWSDQSDDYKYAISNGKTGHRNEIDIFNGDPLTPSNILTTDETDQDITAIDWKGNYLAVVSRGGQVYMFNTTNMSRMWKYSTTDNRKYGVSISPDYTKLAVSGKNYSGGPNNLLIFNIGSSVPIAQYMLPYDGCSIDWSPGSDMIVVSGEAGYIRILDPTNGNELYQLVTSTTNVIYGVRWSSQNLIAAIDDINVKFYAPFDENGPLINITYPPVGFSTTFDTVHFKGSMTDITGIQLAQYNTNNSGYQNITLTPDFFFDQIINISQPQNEIKIKGTDRGNRSSEITKTVFKTPSITVSTNSISSFGNVSVGDTSLAQSYTITGNNLTSFIQVTSSSGFQVSLTSNSGFNDSLILSPTGGIVPTTIIWVRFCPITIGVYTGIIVHASIGAIAQNVAVSGTGIGILIGTPKIWTGIISNDWSNPNNWNPNGVPVSTDDIFIPPSAPNMPLVNNDGFNCNDFTLSMDASLTINPGKLLQ